MAAYVIFLRESPVRDAAAMALYREQNRGDPPQPPPTPLVVYGAIEALEGDAPDGIVVLRFNSLDDARAWYHDPRYQRVIAHRRRAADYRAIIVEGL